MARPARTSPTEAVSAEETEHLRAEVRRLADALAASEQVTKETQFALRVLLTRGRNSTMLQPLTLQYTLAISTYSSAYKPPLTPLTSDQ